MPQTATQPGAAAPAAASSDVKTDEVVVETRSPRDIALEAMAARQEENHAKDIAEGLANDPGAAQIQQGIEQAQADNRAAAEAEGVLDPVELESDPNDGAASLQPLNDPTPEVRKDLPENLQQDPLAEFIVMDNEKPMFVTKVNGENMLIPLDDARRRLQIRVAAEIELGNARKFSKSLDTRAEALDAGERALQARMSTIPQIPNSQEATEQPAQLDESEITSEAASFVHEAFAGTEADAAKKLAQLLLKTRTPTAQPVASAPAIDVQGIVAQAKNEAVSELRAENHQKDLVEGINTFEDQYPDIIGDARLYGMADSMTDEIVMEHPTWPKSRVLLEAGKRTREWVENLKGTASTVDIETAADDAVPPKIVTTSEHARPPQTQTRQERKSGLTRIPRAAVAAVQSTGEPEPERPQSPQEAFAELRASRGQPV